MFKSSILWRLYAGFTVTILVFAVVINILLGDYIQKNSKRQLDASLYTQARYLKEIARPYLSIDANTQSMDELHAAILSLDDQVSSRLTVINQQGQVVADSRQHPQQMDNHLNRPEIKQAYDNGEGYADRYSETLQQPMKYYALQIKKDGHAVGVARVALPLTQIQQAQRQLTQFVLAGCLFASIIALVLGFYFARRFSLPIIALTNSAQAIAQGDYQQRVYLPNKDELGALAHTFNYMASSAHDRVLKITEDRNKLATILSGLVEGVVALDEDQNIIHINEAAARTLNISASASVGSSVWDSIDIVEIHDILQKIFTHGGVSQNQVRVPGVQKDTVIEVYGAALSNPELNLNDTSRHGAILVLHDVSELEMLENVRRDFVTNASHELKTPLTAIRGVIETILHDPEMEKETLWHFLTRVQSQTDRLVNIVSDLMALSRLESGTSDALEPLSLSAIAEQSIKTFKTIAASKHVTLELISSDTEGSDFLVLGDAHSLGQLFDNLIDNAIKYTPDNGKIEITLGQSCENKQTRVWAKVKDNGLGINQADQARIFERFYRVDKGRSRDLGGTGLGLAISKHIAEQHKGELRLESEMGKGSAFIVILPAYAP